MTRIKCCGMTRVEDALLAAQLGADAIGLVFTARSRRQVSLQQARAIRRALPPFVDAVALFMDDEAAFVADVIAALQPDLLQFHGSEPDAWCAQFGRRYLKAIAMGEGAGALPRLRDYPGAAALLLDGHAAGEAGGSGKAFDTHRDKPPMVRRPRTRIEWVTSFLILTVGWFPPGREAPQGSRPAEHVDRKYAEQHFREGLERFNRIAPALLVSRPRDLFVKHPRLGDLTLPEWMRFHLVHDRHHAQQIRARSAA